MMQDKDFQRQTGKMWLVYSKEVINEAMKKVDKMLEEVFTRTSYSSCLHNMVAVFPFYPPTKKKTPNQNQKRKPTRKFPTTG